MNAYNIFDEKDYSTILYHAVARSEAEVQTLAQEAGLDIEGLEIELERSNVKDERGRDIRPYIGDALVY